MSVLLKNWLYLNKCLKVTVKILLTLSLMFSYNANSQKIGNYIYNGSFEKWYNCEPPIYLDKAIGWCNLGSDTTKVGGPLYSTTVGCSNAPYTDAGFQYPRTGDRFFRHSPICLNLCPYYHSRSYPKNRLKGNLKANTTYCVKMFVNLENVSPFATSDFGFYFADASIDTIKYPNGPTTYLTPQVKNPINNIITDTLNWVAITGTFVATGAEKYLVIGNFESNASTTTSLVLSDSTYKWSEYFVDDISCIEVDLPAYAGPDKAVIPGDSVYIGRELDFAVDSGCTWYKLPNMTIPVVKASGLWVKPTITSTYVVKQVLDCSPLKSDTVVVYMNPLGIVSSDSIEKDIQLFPMPSKDFVELSCNNSELLKEFNKVQITNQLGQILREEEIKFESKPIKIKTDELPNGVYFITISTKKNECVTKKLVISK